MSRLGIYIKDSGRYNDIISNRQITHTSKSLKHNLGVVINNNVVKVDDKVVAKTKTLAVLTTKHNDTYIGEINIDDNRINTNSVSYGDLRKGEVPAGYIRYNLKNDYVLDPPDLKYTETIANYTELDCPMLSIRWYNMRINPGQYLNFTYFVDTYYMDSINRENFNNLFRVIIELDNENIVYDETVYPGEHSVTIGPFQEGNEFGALNEFNDTGFRWLGIKAIDSRGCASPENFLDFLVREEQKPNYLEVTPEQLKTEYNIVEGEDCDDYPIIYSNEGEEWKNKEYVWYQNKHGFTKLFLDAKTAGYNGVKLPANRIYTISLYRNTASGEDTIDFNFVRYFICEVNDSKYTSVQEVFKWDTFWQGIVDNNYTYRRAHGNDIIYDLSATPTSVFPVVGNTTTLKAGTHYVAYKREYDVNTKLDTREAYNDCILLPDEFTLDMNNCTFIGSCPDFSMHGSRTIKLVDNFDTHIKNGKFIGVYKLLDVNVVGEQSEVNWRRGGSSTADWSPLESVANIEIDGGSYCSVDNCEVSYGAGYELTVSNRTEPTEGKFSHTYMNGTFKLCLTNGYIDASGNISESPEGLPMVYYKKTRIEDLGFNLLRENPFRHISVSTRYEFGTSHIIFLSFFDSSDNLIKTIKSHKRYLVKVPKNSKYFYISMYGYVDDGTNLDSAWPNISSKFYIYGNFLAIGCSITNCNSHDHRTGTIHVNMSEGTLIRNNVYTRAGSLYGRWAITPHVADFEEGGRYINRVGIIDCVTYKGVGNGSTSIACHSVKNLTFLRNEGFSWYLLTGCAESGLWEGNKKMVWSFSPSIAYSHPHVIFRNNEILEYLLSSAAGYPRMSDNYLEEYPISYTSKCADEIENIITMQDTKFLKASHYPGYNFRRSENGLAITD